MMIKLLGDNPVKSFLGTQYRSLVLKPAMKLLQKSRKGCPDFWTMPYDPICREIILNGYYEKDLLKGMCQLVENKEGTVLDIGANIGNHSVYFSTVFKQVISFEPIPRNCWILKSNLNLNGITNVQLVEKGLGSTNEKLHVAHEDPRNTNNGLCRGESEGAHTVVDVVKGDEELETLSFPNPIVMIKIDVEGFEPEVIKGLESTIKRYKPVIYWEAFNTESVNESKVLLEKMGYQYFYHITTNKHSTKLMNKIANSLGRNVYLKSLEQCVVFDGMNVASPKKLL